MNAAGEKVRDLRGTVEPAVEQLANRVQQAVQRGLGGPQPHSKPTYVALGHLYFDSVPAFEQAFGPHAQQIMADLSNFTNLNPTIQINEVVVE